MKPQRAQGNNRKVFYKWQNDTGCSRRLSLQHPLTHNSVRLTIQIQIFFDNMSSLWTKLIEDIIYATTFASTHWGKACFHLHPHDTLDVLLHTTAACLFLRPGVALRMKFHSREVSKAQSEKGGVNGGRRELFCYRTQCNDAIYNWYANRTAGSLSSPCFHFTPTFSGEAHVCPQ